MTLSPELELTKAMARKFLDAILVTDSELDAFCIDFFPDVHRRFSNNMERVVKVNLLLELKESQEILKRLHLFQPKKFAKYQTELLTGHTPSPSIPNLRPTFLSSKTWIGLILSSSIIFISMAGYILKQNSSANSFYCGNLLDKDRHSPIRGASIMLLATNCEQKTDQVGYFDFSSCQAAKADREIVQKVLIKLPSGTFCDNVPLERPPMCTKISINEDCRSETAPAAPSPKRSDEYPRIDMSLQPGFATDMGSSDMGVIIYDMKIHAEDMAPKPRPLRPPYGIDANFRYISTGSDEIQETAFNEAIISAVKFDAILCKKSDSVFIRKISATMYIIKCNDNSRMATKLENTEVIAALQAYEVESGWLRVRQNDPTSTHIKENPDESIDIN